MRDIHLKMNWFRRHIRHGSRLALFALAIQFVLVFGHVHVAHAQSAGVIADAIIAEYSGGLQTPADDDHDNRGHRALTENCAICAVVAMTATALFGASPVLHLPDAVTFLYRVTDAGFVHLDPAHGAYHARAPPVS